MIVSLARGAAVLRPPRSFSYLGSREIGGLGAARIRLDVEVHLLAFVQGAHAGCFDGGDVHKHVLAAAFRRNETETLGGVEKLHGTDGHDCSFKSSGSAHAKCRGGRGNKNIWSLGSFSVRPARPLKNQKAGSERQKRFV